MPWVKLDDSWLTHPKILTIGKDGRALWLAGLLYSARELTDGHIPKGALPAIAGAAEVRPSTVKRLTEPWQDGANPLWTAVDGGWQIHDYHEYQPSAAKARATSKARAEAGRRGGKTRSKREANSQAKPEANVKQTAKPGAKQNGSKTRTPSPSPPTNAGRNSHVSPVPDDDLSKNPNNILDPEKPPPSPEAVAQARSARLGGGHNAGWIRAVARGLDAARVTDLAGQGHTAAEIDLILDGQPDAPDPTPTHPAIHATTHRHDCPECSAGQILDDTGTAQPCPTCNPITTP